MTPPSGPLYNDNLIMIMITMMAIVTMIIMGRGGGLFQSKKDHCMFVHIHDKCDDDYRKITNMTTSVMIMMMITRMITIMTTSMMMMMMITIMYESHLKILKSHPGTAIPDTS